MKLKVYNNLLLFSLFGIALGFFGIVYEGIVYGPKMFDSSMERMLFWKSFTSIISPLIYYAPWVYLATITVVILYVKAPLEKDKLRKKLKQAGFFQIASLAVTLYILTQINFKRSYGDLERYADAIPGKVIVFNVLSIIRIGLCAMGLAGVFNAYILTQKDPD
ncbi:MAG TPA: hypothetical protein VNZ86_03740 [Bacteroidia bacterium]|nr:hypothetical protein [Bacteroidia bacterium]